MIDNSRVELLDCTLRDGSYPISYQFNLRDTEEIVKKLSACGISYIEVGHGQGIGASGEIHGIMAANEYDHIRIACDSGGNSKIGVFAIPGIASISELKKLKTAGASFIRIGTDANKCETAEPFIKEAKELGFLVSSNVMKSYAVSVPQFIENSGNLLSYGSDIICVVDSAGGMIPQQVAKYVSQLKTNFDCPIGFHGHNNLQLAIANSLVAIENGANIVDGTLRGIGRSAGNAQIEILAFLLSSKLDFPKDNFGLLQLGQVLSERFRIKGGINNIDISSGVASFHSNFLPLVLDEASRIDVSPEEIIYEVGMIESIDITKPIVREAGKNALANRKVYGARSPSENKLLDSIVSTKFIRRGENIQNLINVSLKTNRESILIIEVNSDIPETISFSALKMFKEFSLLPIVVKDITALVHVLKQTADSSISEIYISIPDNEGKSEFHEAAKQLENKNYIFYDDKNATVKSISAFCFEKTIDKNVSKKLLILGATAESLLVALDLVSQGTDVFFPFIEKSSNFVKIALDYCAAIQNSGQIYFADLSMSDIYFNGILVFDPIYLENQETISSFGFSYEWILFACRISESNAIEKFSGEKFTVDPRAGLLSEFVLRKESSKLVHETSGELSVNGSRRIAGGVFGSFGDIVLDSITNPSLILGVADGRGKLMPTEAAVALLKNSDPEIDNIIGVVLRDFGSID